MTAQMHEALILDGERTSMAFCPDLPRSHPRVVAVDPAAALSAGHSAVFSTACWRGYVGTWEVRDGRFYLVGLQGKHRLEGEEPLFADWFTGVLRIPLGERLRYVHMGFGSVYEGDLLIAIEKGRVTRRRTVDNRGGGALLATAVLALLAGNGFAVLRNGHPAVNARTACLLWAGGLCACALVLAKGRRRRQGMVVAALVLAVLLGGSIAVLVAPASR